MKRRDFLEQVSGAVVAIQFAPIVALAGNLKGVNEECDIYENAKRISAPQFLQDRFIELLKELKQKDWSSFFNNEFNINIDPNNPNLNEDLDRILPNIRTQKGFDDFAGIRMIEPGRPSMSLLYHALASPRVKPEISNKPFDETQYLGWEELVVLEDYIYSLLELNIDAARLNKEYVLAVFSYEYRPAYKTPEDSPYADFVYSRTGISRIGQHPYNYNKAERSFTNLPLTASPKEIAVMPAKYGLFLAKVTKASDVHLMSKENGDTSGFSIFKKNRDFLVPVKKIFSKDPFLNERDITFYESHVNEKLARLAAFKGIELFKDENTNYRLEASPFRKINATTDQNELLDTNNSKMVSLIRGEGASVLLTPVDDLLMKLAWQDEKLVCFKVPKEKELILNVDSNRRYTSLKLQSNAYKNASDYIATEGYAKKYRATKFSAPRNAPLFANIRNRVDTTNLKSIEYLSADTQDFDSIISNGGYYTAMFEDNICDGFISAKISDVKSDAVLNRLINNILPAFSLVTAPDFFPYSESFDLHEFDKNKQSSFMEGGIENLSTCRLRANPNLIDPITKSAAFPEWVDLSLEKGTDLPFTMHAILTSKCKVTSNDYKLDSIAYKKSEDRDYLSTSYMTDTASFVFAPGWDATYSANNKKRPFLATIGLGSPFPEDMKLCAAANGMWPVASPDAARTFQGSLKKIVSLGVTPCALPLTDLEIGIHESHPMLKEPGTLLEKCFGWDGEHGPFLSDHKNRYSVEFTDIGRADYVHNLMQPDIGFNMELLRKLTTTEIIFRMIALRRCKTKLEGEKYEFSKYWLVSAEAVNWEKGAMGMGIPLNLIGDNRLWATQPQGNIHGNGFLYVFVDPIYEHALKPSQYDWITNKRRRLQIKNIYVCQISEDALSYCSVSPESKQKSVIWKHG